MTRSTNHLAAFSMLAAALAFADCTCGPVDTAEIVSGDTVVVVSAVSHDITVSRGDRVVLDLDADSIGTKAGVASYEMQFGMFNIVEDSRPFRHATALRILEASATTISIEATDGEAVVATGSVSFRDGGVVVEVTATDGDRVVASTPCAPDHHFLGLGAQSADVDHRGQVVPLWVSEQGVGKTDDDVLPAVWQLLGRRHTTHVPMPAFLRSDAVGVVMEVDAFSRVDLCATDVDVTTFEVWQDTLRLLVLPGDTVLGAQQLLSEALGRPRLLPPYVFAPWNDAIFSEQQVRDFAAFLRDNEIPSSAIWSEDWRGGRDSGDLYRLDEDWRLDRALYPTYEDMTADLQAQGIAHQVYFNTFVTEGGDVFDEITAAGHGLHTASGEPLLFTGSDREFSPTTLVDLSNDDAIAYTKDHLKEALRLGARGWMADFAEWMPVDDVSLASGEDPALFHNEYAVAWARINREAVEEAGLLDEVVLYSRSGFLGSPAVVDVLWAGDQRTSFQADDGFPTIIPIGIGTAITGFTYFAHDIAGYQSSTNGPVTKELFLRWSTMGAFTPVMRTHHGTHARDNHFLQSDADSTAHWKRYAEIHIRLYPYLRALAVADANADKTKATGLGRLPLWVPMPVLFPDDEALWSIKDQVFLGPNLLLAPVVTEGAVARDVVLPGGRFVAFPMPGAPPGSLGQNRAAFAGGTVAVDVAVTEIPVFMPAGAIVPMTALPAQTLLEVEGDAIADLSSTTGDREVMVALGKSGRFVEEDGAGYVLDGTGTVLPAGADADGAVELVGDGVISGDGFTLTLTGHPATRRTRVVFR